MAAISRHFRHEHEGLQAGMRMTEVAEKKKIEKKIKKVVDKPMKL